MFGDVLESQRQLLHVELQSDMECWVKWALAHDVHPAVIGFLRWRPELLFAQKDANLERGWPSPRSWERVGLMLNIIGVGNLRQLSSAVFDLVGNRADVEFIAFVEVSDSMEDILQMMLNPKVKVQIPAKADRTYVLCSAMVYPLWRWQDDKQTSALLDGFYRISLALPSSFAAMSMIDAMSDDEKRAGKLYTHPQYKAWADLHGRAFKKRMNNERLDDDVAANGEAGSSVAQ